MSDLQVLSNRLWLVRERIDAKRGELCESDRALDTLDALLDWLEELGLEWQSITLEAKRAIHRNVETQLTELENYAR